MLIIAHGLTPDHINTLDQNIPTIPVNQLNHRQLVFAPTSQCITSKKLACQDYR